MLTLFGNLESGNDYKVRLAFNHLAIPYRRVEVWQTADEPRRPEFLALNPIGKVPAIQFDDGDVLAESGAILFHFAQDSGLWPVQRRAQSEALRWMFFEQYSHEPHIAVNRYYLKFLPGKAAPHGLLETNHRKGHQALRAMETALQTRAWFAGNSLSVADIALYAYTHNATDGGFSLSGYPCVRAWLARVAAQPGHLQFDIEPATASMTFDDWAAGVSRPR